MGDPSRWMILPILFLASCAANTGIHGMYIDQTGENHSILCVMEKQANGEPWIICYDDEQRGAW